MDFGIAIFATHDAVDPGAVARLVEARGFDSISFPEHTHIPASRQSPYPAGGELPRKYVHTYDLFVAMTAAAVSTTRLRICSGICLLIERDPITTAKEVASVDVLSGGRVELGVGAGWNREEMANHGTYVDFDRIWSWPKPAQRPHPPILVGGNGPTVGDRVLAFGDAWMPIHGPSGLVEQATELRSRADRPIDIIVTAVPADAAVIARYEDAGFRRVVHYVPSAGLGPIEAALDRFEAAIAEAHGE